VQVNDLGPCGGAAAHLGSGLQVAEPALQVGRQRERRVDLHGGLGDGGLQLGKAVLCAPRIPCRFLLLGTRLLERRECGREVALGGGQVGAGGSAVGRLDTRRGGA
jgi:hypothetical protein